MVARLNFYDSCVFAAALPRITVFGFEYEDTASLQRELKTAMVNLMSAVGVARSKVFKLKRVSADMKFE